MYQYTFEEQLLKLDNLHLRLGGRKILDGVSATVLNVMRPGLHQGQVVSFLGPSGVGKSQTFWAIAGLNDPDSGQVLINDPPVPVQPGDVGVVTQHYKLFNHRTVMGNLLVAGKQRGLGDKEAKEKAKALLVRFGLEDRANAWPRELSGGQRQRIAIAQQLLCSDRFLLMDEPFSGLDPVMRDEVIRIIQEIAAEDEKRTIIIITHDVRAALHVSDHLWLIGRDRDVSGKIVSGAKIQEEVDLKVRGLAWRPDKESQPEFERTVREIEARFRTL